MRHYVPPKRRKISDELHRVRSQNMVFLKVISVKTLNLTTVFLTLCSKLSVGLYILTDL
jgi:hypothetical protein